MSQSSFKRQDDKDSWPAVESRHIKSQKTKILHSQKDFGNIQLQHPSPKVNSAPQKNSQELRVVPIILLLHGCISRHGSLWDLWANFLQLGAIFVADLASRPLQGHKVQVERISDLW